MLGTSGMSHDDYKEDPDTLLKVLKFQEERLKGQEPTGIMLEKPKEEQSYLPNISPIIEPPKQEHNHLSRVTSVPALPKEPILIPAGKQVDLRRYSTKPLPAPPGAKAASNFDPPPISKPLPPPPPAKPTNDVVDENINSGISLVKPSIEPEFSPPQRQDSYEKPPTPHKPPPPSLHKPSPPQKPPTPRKPDMPPPQPQTKVEPVKSDGGFSPRKPSLPSKPSLPPKPSLPSKSAHSMSPRVSLPPASLPPTVPTPSTAPLGPPSAPPPSVPTSAPPTTSALSSNQAQAGEPASNPESVPAGCPPDIFHAMSTLLKTTSHYFLLTFPLFFSTEHLISFGDPTKRFVNCVEVGRGSSGTVEVATDTTTGDLVAIKKMILAKGVNQLVTLKAEISIMKDAHHKNIVNYIDSYIVGKTLWCVMEYMDGGDLTEVIRVCGDRLKEYQIATILREVLQGLNYLHTLPLPIIHRDIKSDNILLGLDGSVKISMILFYFSFLNII